MTASSRGVAGVALLQRPSPLTAEGQKATGPRCHAEWPQSRGSVPLQGESESNQRPSYGTPDDGHQWGGGVPGQERGLSIALG